LPCAALNYLSCHAEFISASIQIAQLKVDKDVGVPTVGSSTTMTITPTQKFMREVIPSVPSERMVLAEKIAARVSLLG